ncbi:hypothetical protein [Pyrococcus abyssi]|uniref:Uncharacterized protein n=1 Tax=Pyrococcus abyssi (strain GE5 / Orsay) TaxID=272844 RepID=Q9V1N5_PYRAB|nr:hypothetical protein [Pyrococcus abyssi]CAB49314.1 Hypothetical protein PAB0262 [Pyrococcus abyssi GE5]CCE69770.1 TPA: hypothetical protein PAB0262 [Pyrococcus abyssi GE5]
MEIKKRIRVILVISVLVVMFGSLVNAYYGGKPEKTGLVIELPNPDRVLGRNVLASFLIPKYEYYIQVQLLTPNGFRTIYEGESRGKVLIPSSSFFQIKSNKLKDVNPGVIIDLWIVNFDTGESYEAGTFSLTITGDAVKSIQRFELNLSRENLVRLPKLPLNIVKSKKKSPITPTRGFFAGYRWRTKKEYLAGQMYLPILILDNRLGRASVAGAYKVEAVRSSSSSSGAVLGFSTTIIRGSKLSSKSEISIEKGLASGEIHVELEKGNEFIKTVIDGEVKNVKPGQIGVIMIKGTPYIALQVLQKCYVDEFRRKHCFDTDEERVLITVTDIKREYNPQENAYFVETISYLDPPRSVYPVDKMDELINDNKGCLRILTTLYGEQQHGRSFYIENFINQWTTYSNTYIPVLAIVIALQPEAWPAFLIGLSAVGGIYITNEGHELVYGSFTIKDESPDKKTIVKYLGLKYSIRDTMHFTKFPFAYLRFE